MQWTNLLILGYVKPFLLWLINHEESLNCVLFNMKFSYLHHETLLIKIFITVVFLWTFRDVSDKLPFAENLWKTASNQFYTISTKHQSTLCLRNHHYSCFSVLNSVTLMQSAIICLNLTIEILEQGVKCVQS